MIDVYPASALAFPATTMCLRGQPAISSHRSHRVS